MLQLARQILTKLPIRPGLNSGFYNSPMELSHVAMRQNIRGTYESYVLYICLFQQYEGQVHRERK